MREPIFPLIYERRPFAGVWREALKHTIGEIKKPEVRMNIRRDAVVSAITSAFTSGFRIFVESAIGMMRARLEERRR